MPQGAQGLKIRGGKTGWVKWANLSVCVKRNGLG